MSRDLFASSFSNSLSSILSGVTGRGLVSKSARDMKSILDRDRGKSCLETGTCRPNGFRGSVLDRFFGYSSGYSSGSSGSAFGFLFILSLTVFIIFLILTFINYTMFPIFSFSPNDSALITIPNATDREVAYTRDPAVPNLRRDKDTKLDATSLPLCCIYTIGADILINGGLKPISYPNVILYRDLESNASTLSKAPKATASTLNMVYTNTNILVWMDQHTNDLNITLVTVDVGGAENLQTMSPPVQNVPLNKTFRLALLVADSFVELYINGQLERTIAIQGNLKQAGQSTNATDFYPPVADESTGGVRISNMSMWPRILSSKEIRAFEADPMSSR